MKHALQRQFRVADVAVVRSNPRLERTVRPARFGPSGGERQPLNRRLLDARCSVRECPTSLIIAVLRRRAEERVGAGHERFR